MLRGSARQRADENSGGSGEAPVAVLHPLRRVSESLPGLPEDRRLFVSVGLFGTHRKDSDAAVHGTRTGSVAAVRIESVRRVRRGLSGQNRDSENPIGIA